MTGIERLRALAGAWDEWGLGGALAEMADEIERERAEDYYRMGLDHGTVWRVVGDMERHCLGHEGMEDSPVARWARELCKALCGDGRDHAADVSVSAYDLLPQEDRESVAWVREHGGLDAVEERLAPKVLDADGVEVRVKEAVVDKNTGKELIVIGFEDGCVWCEHRMTDADALPVRGTWSPGLLTHERPDSWERLEEDAEKDPCDYFGFDGEEICGRCPASGKNCEQTMALDIVRRAKALAERERGE